MAFEDRLGGSALEKTSWGNNCEVRQRGLEESTERKECSNAQQELALELSAMRRLKTYGMQWK